jgi:hypothetical protein
MMDSVRAGVDGVRYRAEGAREEEGGEVNEAVSDHA